MWRSRREPMTAAEAPVYSGASDSSSRKTRLAESGSIPRPPAKSVDHRIRARGTLDGILSISSKICGPAPGAGWIPSHRRGTPPLAPGGRLARRAAARHLDFRERRLTEGRAGLLLVGGDAA